MANFDLTSRIIDYENGSATEDETIELFQELVDTGMAWKLQGHYGRTAAAMIENGDVIPPCDGHSFARQSNGTYRCTRCMVPADKRKETC